MRRSRTGLLSLAAVAGYYAWQNRSRIQQFLRQQGINFGRTQDTLSQSRPSSMTQGAADVSTDDNYIRNASGI